MLERFFCLWNHLCSCICLCLLAEFFFWQTRYIIWLRRISWHRFWCIYFYPNVVDVFHIVFFSMRFWILKWIPLAKCSICSRNVNNSKRMKWRKIKSKDRLYPLVFVNVFIVLSYYIFSTHSTHKCIQYTNVYLS